MRKRLSNVFICYLDVFTHLTFTQIRRRWRDHFAEPYPGRIKVFGACARPPFAFEEGSAGVSPAVFGVPAEYIFPFRETRNDATETVALPYIQSACEDAPTKMKHLFAARHAKLHPRRARSPDCSSVFRLNHCVEEILC